MSGDSREYLGVTLLNQFTVHFGSPLCVQGGGTEGVDNERPSERGETNRSSWVFYRGTFGIEKFLHCWRRRLESRNTSCFRYPTLGEVHSTSPIFREVSDWERRTSYVFQRRCLCRQICHSEESMAALTGYVLDEIRKDGVTNEWRDQEKLSAVRKTERRKPLLLLKNCNPKIF